MVMLVASSASAEPPTLAGAVHYNFVDQNGFGWAMVTGKVTVTLDLNGKTPSLNVTGKRRWVDGRVTGTASPAMDTSNKWEGDVDETYPLRAVTRAKNTITFKLDPIHDKLTASCAPITLPTNARTTLYECSFTGFQWNTIASLPELHHPIVLDANVKAKTKVLNSMRGKAKPQFGQRTVTEPKPANRR